MHAPDREQDVGARIAHESPNVDKRTLASRGNRGKTPKRENTKAMQNHDLSQKMTQALLAQ